MEGAVHYEQSHRLAAQAWYRINLVLGAAAALSTAVVAAITVAASKTSSVAVASSLIAAALTAVFTFMKPGDRASQHLTAQRALSSFRGDLRRFNDLVRPFLPHDELPVRIQEYADRRTEILNVAPQYAQRTYSRAARQLKTGLLEYSVDQPPRSV